MTRLAIILLLLIGCFKPPSEDSAPSQEKPKEHVYIGQKWLDFVNPHDNPFRKVSVDTFVVLATRKDSSGDIWVQYQWRDIVHSEREDVFTCYKRKFEEVK